MLKIAAWSKDWTRAPIPEADAMAVAVDVGGPAVKMPPDGLPFGVERVGHRYVGYAEDGGLVNE